MNANEIASVATNQTTELVTVKAMLNAIRTTLTQCEINGAANQDQIDRLLLVTERKVDDVIFELSIAVP
jgi:hypothetical protein